MRAGRKQCQQAARKPNRERVVHSWRKRSQQIETNENNDRQEECVVVEDREGGRLEVGHLVLLPQDPFVLLLLAHLLVVGELLAQIARDGVLALHGDLVLERELRVAVRHRQQVRGGGRHDEEEHHRREHVDHVDAPEEPYGNR